MVNVLHEVIQFVLGLQFVFLGLSVFVHFLSEDDAFGLE
jgi:hypothetical protein